MNRMRACSINVAVGALLAWAPACRRDQDREHRRERLNPPPSQVRAEQQRKARARYAEDGELLPSELKVAGVTLPRGMVVVRGSERSWSLRGQNLPLDAVE